MRLQHKMIRLPIVREDDCVSVLVVEHGKLFREILTALDCQADGQEGEFVLSEKGDPIDIAKQVSLLLEPIHFNLNSRQAVNRLYSFLEEKSVEQELNHKVEIKLESIRNLLGELIYDEGMISMASTQVSLPDVFKLFGICFSIDDVNSYVEQLQEYLLSVTKYIGKRLFVFAQLFSFLTDKEIFEFVSFVKREELNVLLIERWLPETVKNPYGQILIVDQDYCEIVR